MVGGIVVFIDHYTHLYQIVRHQLRCTIHSMNITSYITLDTIILVLLCLCQAGNVWIEYTISLFQIQFYAAIFYGVLLRIFPATFLQLKIQLEMARFETRTFQEPV